MAYGWDESERAHEQVYNGEQHHEGKFSHEFVAGAASFAAMKAYEDHERKEGKPSSHKLAKELIAGLVGGEVDKLAETKGMNWLDREKAEHHAKKNVEHMYEERYEQHDNGRDNGRDNRDNRDNYRDNGRDNYREDNRNY